MLKRYIVWLIFVATSIFSLAIYGQTFSDQDGTAIRLEDFKDKLVMFVYLAPGCHFCQKEVLALNELMAAHPDEIVVLGANREAFTVDELQEFRAGWKINFTMLQQDPTEFLKLRSVNMVPTMVIMKPNGEILSPVVGLRSREQLETILFDKT
jgi:thiol-disulfide isomerase/thioredoxin